MGYIVTYYVGRSYCTRLLKLKGGDSGWLGFVQTSKLRVTVFLRLYLLAGLTFFGLFSSLPPTFLPHPHRIWLRSALFYSVAWSYIDTVIDPLSFFGSRVSVCLTSVLICYLFSTQTSVYPIISCNTMTLESKTESVTFISTLSLRLPPHSVWLAPSFSRDHSKP